MDKIRGNNDDRCNVKISEKQTQVDEQMHMLDSRLDSIHEHIMKLQSKLNSVLRQEPVPPSKEICCNEDEMVPLAGHLRGFSNRAVEMDEFIIDILRRLEI